MDMRCLVAIAAVSAIALSGCQAQASPRAAGTPKADAVVLNFYHCGVVPFRYDGALWVQKLEAPEWAFDESSKPEDISGHGIVLRQDDVLRYTDESGGDLTFARWTRSEEPVCA